MSNEESDFEGQWIPLFDTGVQAQGWQLVDLRPLTWRGASFVATLAFRDVDGHLRLHTPGTELPTGSTIDLAHWNDHQHCEICWFKFMGSPSGEPPAEGMTDGEGRWLCLRCHDALVRWWAENPAPKE